MSGPEQQHIRETLFSWKMYPFWIFLTALVLSLSIAVCTQIPVTDMNRYCPMAHAFSIGDWGNAFHPRVSPLVPVLGGVLEFLTGLDSFSALKLLSSLAFALTVFPLYGIFRRFLEEIPARIGILMAAFASMSLRYASTGLRDSTKGLLYIVCVYLLVRIFEEKRTIWNYLYFGVATGLLALTRTECFAYTGLFLATVFAVELFRGKAVLPWRTLLAVLAALAVMLPWLCYMNRTIGYPVPQVRYADCLKTVLRKLSLPAAPAENKTVRRNTGKTGKAVSPRPVKSAKVRTAGPEIFLNALRKNMEQTEAEEAEDRSDDVLIRFFNGLVKGFYPPFAILALAGIFLRIRERKWGMAESVVCVSLLVHMLLLVLQIRIADHAFYISRRYLLPVTPLEFGWSAYGACAIYQALHARLELVRRPSFPIVLFAVALLLLYLHGASRILKTYTSTTKSLERKTLLEFSEEIRKDYKGPARFRRTGFDPGNYLTNLRPTVFSSWEQLGILCGGQSLYPGDPDWQAGRIQPDYILFEEKEISAEILSAAGYEKVLTRQIDGTVFQLYRSKGN